MPSILPYPDFISQKLQAYLKLISEQSGRYIVFCDAEETPRPMALASIDTDTEITGAAIFIPCSKINPDNYAHALHDPIIAHEATHLQLYAEGWASIACKNDPMFEEANKITTIYNWLTDPVINERIEKHGFSIKKQRIEEIVESTNALRQGIWLQNLIKNPNTILDFIRLFVSFSLEPNIPSKIKIDFQVAYKASLPEPHFISRDILEVIKFNGFDTPDKFKRTSLLCMSVLGINIENRGVYFKEPWLKFNLEQRTKWALDNGIGQ
jgi:hypothetical protein